jgi:hypothetical protein
MGLDETHSTYVQWCFDEAVDYFGGEVQAAVDNVKGKSERNVKGRKENVLRGLLGLERRYAPIRGKAPVEERPEAPFKME